MTIATQHPRIAGPLAALGAIVLGTAGFLAAGVSASAAPIGDVGAINTARNGTSSLTVHKHEQTTTNGTTRGTGAAITVTAPPISGATFTMTPIFFNGTAVNLTTNAGWATAEQFRANWGGSAASLPANFTLGTGAQSLTTDATGAAAFTNKSFGLYLVQETTAPAAVTDLAAPFAVTLPFPTGATGANANEWLYDVHAYPKNAITGIDIEANNGDGRPADAGYYANGDVISWTTTSNVPALPTGVPLSKYILTNTITTAEQTFITNGSQPANISALGLVYYTAAAPTVAVPLVAADYSIAYTTVGGSSVATVTFTAAGLTKLQNNAQGGKVDFTIPARIASVPTNGIINNSATVDANDAGVDATDVDPSPVAQLDVLKYASTPGVAAGSRTPLAGAVFSLYHDTNNNNTYDAGTDLQVTVNSVNSWTTTSTGRFATPIGPIKPGSYFLSETTPPVGYLPNTTPIAVTVATGPVVTTAGSERNYVSVQNQQYPAYLLPFTGSNGVLTFTILGGAIMVLALGFALVAFRRRTQTEQPTA